MSEPFTTTLNWEGRDVRLSYEPRRWSVIDHVEIRSADEEPLPITGTGYKSHFFGPVEPPLTIAEVQQMVVDWLDKEAAKPEWKKHLEQSRQLSLF